MVCGAVARGYWITFRDFPAGWPIKKNKWATYLQDSEELNISKKADSFYKHQTFFSYLHMFYLTIPTCGPSRSRETAHSTDTLVSFSTVCNIQQRHGGSMVARQTVVLQSRVQIRHLPSPQLTANLLVGCHLGYHLVAG
jgi:hypothetical protein